MRGLLLLVIIMGVLILAGVATVAVTILHRMGPARVAAGGVLDEPPGTRIVGASAFGDRLAVVLQGGGPDRVVLVDPASGRNLGEVRLAREREK
jgi:hypothetical protein